MLRLLRSMRQRPCPSAGCRATMKAWLEGSWLGEPVQMVAVVVAVAVVVVVERTAWED